MPGGCSTVLWNGYRWVGCTKSKIFQIYLVLCDACCCNGIDDLELTCKEKIQRGSELRILEVATF